MKRALSVRDILSSRFHTLPFEGLWREAVGEPELTGTWIVYGASKNGKTSFSMMLSKYLTTFARVAYNSVEEGLSETIKKAVERANMIEVSKRWLLLNKESKSTLEARLSKQRSPDIVFIDTVQFMELTFNEYKDLKERFRNKLFVYVSHVDGRQPAGSTAVKIMRDANVLFRVEGYKAFPVSRYGGGEPITIWEKGADEYWGKIEK